MREHQTPSGLTVIMRSDAPVVGRCYVCGIPFYSQQEGERHVGPCARSRLGEIQAERAKNRIPMFDEELWDKELEDHYRAVGQRMVAEGRMVMHKNERAGFS